MSCKRQMVVLKPVSIDQALREAVAWKQKIAAASVQQVKDELDLIVSTTILHWLDEHQEAKEREQREHPKTP